MRIVREADSALDFDFKGELEDVPEGYVAWFDAARPSQEGLTVVCGHWSALGLVMREDLIALDTGCVWGRHLTAVRLDDRQIFQVKWLQD
jgi:bis(5'-nucleosyl)-tetraphosphatase (symmetrical)